MYRNAKNARNSTSGWNTAANSNGITCKINVVYLDLSPSAAALAYAVSQMDFEEYWYSTSRHFSSLRRWQLEQLDVTEDYTVNVTTDYRCDSIRSLMAQIVGFPTLKLFSAAQSKPVDYMGERTTRHIISWLLRKTDPGVKQAHDVDTVTRFVNSELIVVLGFFAVRVASLYNKYVAPLGRNHKAPTSSKRQLHHD